MNYKRRKPKNARAGCLHCKPWKMNGAKNKNRASVKRKMQVDPPDKEPT